MPSVVLFGSAARARIQEKTNRGVSRVRARAVRPFREYRDVRLWTNRSHSDVCVLGDYSRDSFFLAHDGSKGHWNETPEEFAGRLRDICRYINRNYDVSGVCKSFPKCVQKVVDADGDRINK